MGELITAQALNPPTPAAVLPGAPLPTQSGGFDLRDIKEIVQVAADAIKNIKEIKEMTSKMAPAPAPQSLGSQLEPVPVSATVQPVRPVTMNARVDRARLRALLNDLVVVQAAKLPDDIKQKKLDELIGQNFVAFKYQYQGAINVDGGILLDIVTDQLANSIDGMILTEAKQ